jgi:hypothetical protein
MSLASSKSKAVFPSQELHLQPAELSSERATTWKFFQFLRRSISSPNPGITGKQATPKASQTLKIWNESMGIN